MGTESLELLPPLTAFLIIVLLSPGPRPLPPAARRAMPASRQERSWARRSRPPTRNGPPKPRKIDVEVRVWFNSVKETEYS